MSTYAIVRVLHIVLAVFWAGTMFFFVTFLEPAIRSLGPDGGRVMQALQARRMLDVLITIAFATLLTGAYVFFRISGGLEPDIVRSPYGMTLMLGAGTGTLALLIGLFVSRPTMRRMGRIAQTIGQRGPPAPAELAQLERLRTRLRWAARIAASLLLLTIIAMASARFVPAWD